MIAFVLVVNQIRVERPPNRINWSRHSYFTERTQRSAKAFRLGAWGGSLVGLTPAWRNTVSKASSICPVAQASSLSRV